MARTSPSNVRKLTPAGQKAKDAAHRAASAAALRALMAHRGNGLWLPAPPEKWQGAPLVVRGGRLVQQLPPASCKRREVAEAS